MIFFLLQKAEQLGLFEKVVRVKGSTRSDGTTVAPHTAIRHVRAQEPVRDEAARAPDMLDGAPLPRADLKVTPPEAPLVPPVVEDREDLADAMARDPHSDEAAGLIGKIADAGRPAPMSDDLDPSSSNYRFRDTGYVAGSRKELAATLIRRMARAGERVRVTDVDWDALEENPREAKELITKSNLFGEVDWDTIKASGMEPGAGFLLSKVYAAVGTTPAADGPAARRDFSLAIDTLRGRLEIAHTAQALLGALDEIAAERDGAWLNAHEQRLYDGASAAYREARAAFKALEDRSTELHGRASQIEAQLSKHKYEASQRERRKWAPKPELDALIAGMQPEAEAARAAHLAYRKAHGLEPIVHRVADAGSVTTRFEYPARAQMDRARAAMDTVKLAALMRNRAENPMTRAWASLGSSFSAVLDYRSSKGSEAFAKHVATVKAGKVVDWDWADRRAEPRGATKRSTTFQLHVADVVERQGGRDVGVGSTDALKRTFNLREVQSGNWVLDDPNSAKFHVEACAGAFADLADMLGVADSDVSFHGRLAMAFGARGKGGAKAHYEPIQRVINITKMAGAGSLAHEWLHCVDNLVKEAITGVPSDVEDFATENPGLVDDPHLQAAFAELTDAMMSGPHRKTSELAYTDAEQNWAKHNLSFGHGRVRSEITGAKTLQDAVDGVDRLHAGGAFGPPDKRKSKASRDSWRKIALIHHGANAERKVRYATGPGMSSYLLDAMELDQGDAGKYWSTPREMAARAFSGYIEDKLAAAGRKNTYLVSDANNAAYGGQARPFPDREERERINAAFDKLFGLIRKDGTLTKAAKLLAESLGS